MALVLDATAGGETANVYLTLAEAEDYFDARLYSDVWFDAGADDQEKALVQATRLLDTWFDWFGGITDLHQALLWPRSGVLRPGVTEGATGSGATNDWGEPFGVLLDAHEIPVQIKNATAELALSLLVSDRTADSDIETQGIRSLTAGPVSLTFASSVTAKPIPDAVMVMVTALGTPRSRSGHGAITLQRG